MHHTEKAVEDIKAKIAEATTSLTTTRDKIKEKAAAISALREDLRRQIKPHAGSNKFPAAIRQGQERLGLLTSDCDLLTDYADDVTADIEQLQGRLADAMTVRGKHLASQRAEDLKAVHQELADEFMSLAAHIAEKTEDVILPLVERLEGHRAEAIVQDLGCGTITCAWERHPELMQALLVAYRTMPALVLDATPLADAARQANDLVQASGDWIAHYVPSSVRHAPTAPPAPTGQTQISWKHTSKEEARRAGCLVVVNGKEIIIPFEAAQALREQKQREKDSPSPTELELAAAEGRLHSSGGKTYMITRESKESLKA